MKAILLVTWFVMGQQPHSYQVVFETKRACEDAVFELLKSAKVLEATSPTNFGPRISVLCANLGEK